MEVECYGPGDLPWSVREVSRSSRSSSVGEASTLTLGTVSPGPMGTRSHPGGAGEASWRHASAQMVWVHPRLPHARVHLSSGWMASPSGHSVVTWNTHAWTHATRETC